MYIVVIAWMYVVLMMSVAEATNATGTVLGAIVTFIFYGLLPIALVVYLMRSPGRNRANKARRAEFVAREAAAKDAMQSNSLDPNAASHAPAAAQPDSVPPVREVP
jgi:4'-phosphopantetheinyl transferase EntD